MLFFALHELIGYVLVFILQLYNKWALKDSMDSEIWLLKYTISNGFFALYEIIGYVLVFSLELSNKWAFEVSVDSEIWLLRYKTLMSSQFLSQSAENYEIWHTIKKLVYAIRFFLHLPCNVCSMIFLWRKINSFLQGFSFFCLQSGTVWLSSFQNPEL